MPLTILFSFVGVPSEDGLKMVQGPSCLVPLTDLFPFVGVPEEG